MRVVLFGASKLGEIAFSYLKNNYNIVAFCDNDKNKVDNLFCGIKVIESSRLQKEFKDCSIIITSQYHIYIARQLLSLGIKMFYLFEKEEEQYVLTKFDYSNYTNFNIIENKVALIVENNSGSNTNAILKLSNQYSNLNLQLVKIDEDKKSNDYYYELFTSKAIIRTHEGPYLEDKINIQLWHGFPLKGLSYMSKYSMQNTEYVHNEWRKIDKVFSYSTLYNTLMGACYGIDCEKFYLSGMPRNDFLFQSNGKEKLEKILKRKIKEKIIFYMPTFRESLFGEINGSKLGYIFNFSDYKPKEFNKFLIENNLIFIVKMHPVDYSNFKDKVIANLSNIVFIDDNDFLSYDLYEILNSIDILITDYSSIYFDFLLLNKPIVFIDKDRKEYFDNRGILLEPYDFWTPGPKVENMKCLQDEMLNCIKMHNYYKDERNTICNLVHKYRDGNSTKRILNEINNMINN